MVLMICSIFVNILAQFLSFFFFKFVSLYHGKFLCLESKLDSYSLCFEHDCWLSKAGLRERRLWKGWLGITLQGFYLILLVALNLIPSHTHYDWFFWTQVSSVQLYPKTKYPVSHRRRWYLSDLSVSGKDMGI